jgi:ribonuclease Z
MTTTVTITGTGIPPVEAGRAGPGVLVRYRDEAAGTDMALQFDAGRGTAMRIAEAGLHPAELDAVFITHHHSDHLTGLADLLFTAWVRRPVSVDLQFFAPDGPSLRFLQRMLIPYEDDLAVRRQNTTRPDPDPGIHGFHAGPDPTVVWTDRGVSVLSRTVHHEPVEPAVAYRVETPDGAVVISGDTRVCSEVEEFVSGCEVLVHEAFRAEAYISSTGDERARELAGYHADTRDLGSMCSRCRPKVLMLTHLAPPPRSEDDVAAFEADVRGGGYVGELIVANDLDTVTFG